MIKIHHIGRVGLATVGARNGLLRADEDLQPFPSLSVSPKILRLVFIVMISFVFAATVSTLMSMPIRVRSILAEISGRFFLFAIAANFHGFSIN
jgi:ABC-type glucose/galactose transport system permease subunit